MTSVINTILTSVQNIPEKKKEQNTDVPNIKIDIEQIKPFLVNMAQLIKSRNSDVENELDEFKKILQGKGFDDQLKELEQMISDFNFKKALIPLHNIMKALGIKDE